MTFVKLTLFAQNIFIIMTCLLAFDLITIGYLTFSKRMFVRGVRGENNYLGTFKVAGELFYDQTLDKGALLLQYPLL